MVYSFSILYFDCICDTCGKRATIQQSETRYNRAQAVRSIGWSYGKDKKVTCSACRQKKKNDRYK